MRIIEVQPSRILIDGKQVLEFCSIGEDFVYRYKLAGMYTHKPALDRIGQLLSIPLTTVDAVCLWRGLIACKLTAPAVKALPATLAIYQGLKDKTLKPSGTFDRKGRFYPDHHDAVWDIRKPSAAHPYSYLKACRTKRYAFIAVMRSKTKNYEDAVKYL